MHRHISKKKIRECFTELYQKFQGSHTVRSIKDRWNNFLSKDQSDFSESEDESILYYYSQYGNQWSKIAQNLTNRSPTQVKIRYFHLRKFKNQALQVDENDFLDSQLFNFDEEYNNKLIDEIFADLENPEFEFN